tara:strand:- start:231 stop:512 length:282 start_codon:yes stop_codon:yes gene_type:complete
MAKNYRLYAYREEMDFVSFIQKFNKLEDATQYTNIHEPDEDYEGCELVLYNPVSGKTLMLLDWWEKLNCEAETNFLNHKNIKNLKNLNHKLLG